MQHLQAVSSIHLRSVQDKTCGVGINTLKSQLWSIFLVIVTLAHSTRLPKLLQSACRSEYAVTVTFPLKSSSFGSSYLEWDWK